MILVTGAAGHIGNVLIRKLLERGEKVRALIMRGEDTTSLQGMDIEMVEGDVLDPQSLARAFLGVDTVYHLAGIISIMPGRNPFVWKVNVEGTRNVLAEARRRIAGSDWHAGLRYLRADTRSRFDRERPGDVPESSLGFRREAAEPNNA